MLVAIAAQLAVAALLPALARPLGARVYLVGAAAPAAVFGWLVATGLGPVGDGATPARTLRWAPGLGLSVMVRLDPLSLLMALLVTGIGALVLAYARWYHAGDAEGQGPSAAALLAFAAAMLGLVLADGLLTLYVFWELTTVCSFLLIGGDGVAPRERRAAAQALLVTTTGGLPMLFGFVLLGQAAGTYRISAVVAHPPAATGQTLAAAALILLGAATKSAQAPFHPWLPAAMVAPTPVSAYLHAAAMVKAGVFLVATLTPAFAAAGGYTHAWAGPAAVLGAVTTLLGGLRAQVATDLKRLLALGTVSQLGLLTMLLGLGWRTTALAGAALILAHALAKAALFMAVGIIDHRTGGRDLRELSGVGRRAPVLCAATAVAGASMAGLPPTVGFLAKEATLGGLWHGPAARQPAILAVAVASAALTVGYTLRFLWGAFGSKRGAEPSDWRPASPAFSGPPVLLAAAGLGLGFAAPALDGLLAGYADTLPAGAQPGQPAPYQLALWHGAGAPLALTAGALAAGLVIFLAGWSRPSRRVPGARGQVWRPAAPAWLAAVADAQRWYERTLAMTGRLALAVTARTQVGSLPTYLATILTVTLAVPGAALLTRPVWPRRLPLWDYPIQLPLAAIVLVSAVAVARAPGPLAAALQLGAVGYGIGALFVVEGAPDLALAQFLVESLLLLAFVFVLRRLPDRFSTVHRAPVLRWPRVLISLGVGAFAAVFAVETSAAHRGTSAASLGYIARAPLDAGATNVVTAIVLDFRAFDTLGEITVLAVAALGVTSLLLSAAHPPGVGGAASLPVEVDGAAGARPGSATRSRSRSVLIEVTARAVFPVVLVFSVYLLFAGHSRTGGGFAGGGLVGLAFTLRYVAGARDRVGAAVPVSPTRLIGAGLTVATMAALAPVPFGGAVLDGHVYEVGAGPFGHVELATSLLFDFGVYLVVVGVVLDLLGTLGVGIDEESNAATAAVGHPVAAGPAAAATLSGSPGPGGARSPGGTVGPGDTGSGTGRGRLPGLGGPGGDRADPPARPGNGPAPAGPAGGGP